MLSLRQRFTFFIFSIGCFCCYIVFGILQERIFKQGYDNSDNRTKDEFRFPFTFVWLQCTAFTIIAKAILLTRDDSPNETEQSYYALMAVFYSIGHVTSNTALQFISFPTQVVGKALKPIPTIFFGFLVGGKSYPCHKYLFIILIVCGAVLFAYQADENGNKDSSIGYALIGVSLLMNGGTAGVQEKMRSVKRPSSLHLMLYMNMWSSMFLTLCVACSGESFPFIDFCTKHPEILMQIGLVLIVGSFGQLFLSALIINFGVVACCLVMTVRKFFSVLLSVLLFGNDLSIRQGIATTVIFMSLLADAVLSARLSDSDKKDGKRCEKSANIQGDEEKMKQVLNETIHM